MIGEPGQEALVALGRVGEGEGRYLAAALIEQRGGMAVLVDIDADDQSGLLVRG